VAQKSVNLKYSLVLTGMFRFKPAIAVSSPDEVDFLNLPNPSSRTMALGLTQLLTEMSTRNLPEGQRVAGA
jgi:hypothetical protein